MIPIQIVGYKNSGKTTLIGKLVRAFSAKQYNVATLKHHGHGGQPAANENTDSEKFRKAGAVISGVEGDGVLQLSVEQPSWRMEEIIEFYQIIKVDILMIEGYKQLPFHKVVLIRNEDDLELLQKVTNTQAVVTQLDLKQTDFSFPIIKESELFNWLENNLVRFSGQTFRS